MSRDGRLYNERREWTPPADYQGISTEIPVAGYYRTRLRSGSMFVGVRIWFGAPHDPVTGEEMDRSHRWQAEANGRYIEIDRVWPGCAKTPIDNAEYEHLKSLQDWALDAAPQSPIANPSRKMTALDTPMMF